MYLQHTGIPAEFLRHKTASSTTLCNTLFLACFSEHNNVKALVTAERNVEEHYSVVGILEDLKMSFTVFEKYLPKYFTGLQSTYQKGSIHLSHCIDGQAESTPKQAISDQF